MSLCSIGEELLAVQVSALWPESTWRRLFEVTRDFPRSRNYSHEVTNPAYSRGLRCQNTSSLRDGFPLDFYVYRENLPGVGCQLISRVHLRVTGEPLTRVAFRLTLTSTRSAMLMKGYHCSFHTLCGRRPLSPQCGARRREKGRPENEVPSYVQTRIP